MLLFSVVLNKGLGFGKKSYFQKKIDGLNTNLVLM